MKKGKTKAKAKPKPKPKVKVTPKAKGKLKPKPRAVLAPRIKKKRMLTAGDAVVVFPQPGPQNCYLSPPAVSNATFTVAVNINAGSGVTVTCVRLVIGNAAPILANPAVADPIVANQFDAVFPTVTLANGALTPNTPCILVVETSDGASIGFRFSHVPPAARIGLAAANPGVNHSLTVTATTANVDLSTLLIAPVNGSLSVFTTPTTSPFTFNFSALSALPQPGVSITAKNSDDEDTVTLLYDLFADFTPPNFEIGPSDASEADSFIIIGEISDPAGVNSPASGINAAANPLVVVSINGPSGPLTPGTGYMLEPLVQTTPLSAEYQIVIPGATAGTYTVTMTATDISGNTSPPQTFALLYTPPS